jgi:hypothetical protein
MLRALLWLVGLLIALMATELRPLRGERSEAVYTGSPADFRF